MKNLILIGLIFIICFGCSPQVKNKPKQEEFIQLRIRRWTALEGGEIFHLRKVGKEWSATLMGDGVRVSCRYKKTAKSKSDWNEFWESLKRKRLLEISEGEFGAFGWEDGSGFDVEVLYENRFKRFHFFLPEELDTKDAKSITEIGNLISNEFDTPIFKAKYDRGEVGEYLIENCKDIRK